MQMNSVDDMSLMWETVRNAPPPHDPVTQYKSICIRVYVGADKNPQDEAFKAAWKSMKPILEDKMHPVTFFEPEYLYIEQVNRHGMNMKDLVDWLLQSDIHFILGHVHQGYASHNVALDMRDVQYQLKRLKFHSGFPHGDFLTCPVFTQDKAEYLKHLGVGDMCNPTFFVDLVDDGVLNDSIIQTIGRFCEENTEGIGYIVKAPFTTNCAYIRFLNDVEGVIAAVENACHELIDV